MGSLIGKGMKVGKYSKDIPQLTEYLANDPTFIKYALKVNKSTNKGLTRFQKFLHDSAFPEDIEDNQKNEGSKKPTGSLNDDKKW